MLGLSVGGKRGFTLIELMIVIAIIGILASLAIPSLNAYRKRGYNTAANADIKNAYSAAQAYFSDYPSGSITTRKIVAYGFKTTDNVSLAVVNSTQSGFSMTASHTSGDRTYKVDSEGNITY